MPSAKRRAKFAQDALLGMLVLLAGAEFALRGPVRFAHTRNFNDFLSPYVQTKAWLQGADPYSPQSLVRFWPADAAPDQFDPEDVADRSLVLKRGIPTGYPLTTLVLIAPLALLPWNVAFPLWMAITLGAFFIAASSVFRVARIGGRTLTYAFLALALALAPFHTGIAAGCIITVAVAAVAAALWAAEEQREVLAGILLAVAVGLKPQIGLPFVFFYLLRRRWRIPVVSSVLVALLFVVALIRLSVGGTPWVQSYLYDSRVLLGPGSLGDFTEQDPIRFGLINFQVAAYTILHSRALANFAAMAIAGAAGLFWLFLFFRQREGKEHLLALSALAVLSCLPVYHRFYDADLLILPLAWSLAALDSGLRTQAKAVLGVIMAVFLVPGGSALEQFLRAGHFASVRNSWWWNTVVMPHESWSVLLLGLLLLWAMHVQSRAAATQPNTPALQNHGDRTGAQNILARL